MKHEFSRNGRLDGTSHHSQNLSFSAVSPKSPYDDDDDEEEFYEDHNTETLDRRYDIVMFPCKCPIILDKFIK